MLRGLDLTVCRYVLIAIVKKRLALEASLYSLLQVLSVNIFERLPINQLLAKPGSEAEPYECDNQLNLIENLPGSNGLTPLVLAGYRGLA